jgi:hypothetical protein
VKNGIFIEEKLLNSVTKLLSGRVNELLGEMEFMIPPIEFAHKSAGGYYAVTPDVAVLGCERSEKERIIRLDAYKAIITFVVAGEHGERNCYAYAASVDRAVGEDPTLGGTADYAMLVQKQYAAPKHPEMGEPWEVVLTIRIITENIR